jgi:hypothetical protein
LLPGFGGLGSLSLLDANDPDRLLLLAATKTQLSRSEQPIDDQDVLVNTAVDDLGLALGTDDEDRRHLALHDAARENDIDTAAIVEDGNRPPWRRISGQAVAIVARRLDRDDGRCRNGLALTGRQRG